MTSDSVVVVGAGIAGAACARELREAGLGVRVLDRGRAPGGRMTSRTMDDRRVDLGASYLTVSDPGFGAVVEDWHDRGLARPWTRRFTVLSPDEDPRDKEGPLRWGAQSGLRSLVEDLLEGIEVTRRTVEHVRRGGTGWTVDGEAARAVVLAMPDPQARRLLVDDADATAALGRDWEPVLALAARFERRTWDHLSPGGVWHAAFVNDHDVLDFVADDGRRRGDDAPVLVAHSTTGLAAAHLEDPQAVLPAMTRALVELLDLANPLATHLHRWSFARPTGEREAPYWWQDGLGVCGDGWGPASKVEAAWLSGARLGRRVAQELGG